MDLVFTDCKLVLPTGLVDGGVAVDEGRIVSLGKSSHLPASDKTIECRGRILCPGFVDPHVHVYIPGWLKETFRTGSAAAAVGGITTFLEMPSLGELLTTSVAAFEKKRIIGEGESYVDFGLYGGEIQTVEDTREIEAVSKRGAVGFKIMLSGPTAPKDNAIVCAALEKIRDAPSIAAIHAESNDLVDYCLSHLLHQQRADAAAYSESRPNFIEEEAISRIAILGRAVGTRLHLAHLSTKEGLRIVRSAKRSGSKPTCETHPQYLLLSKDDYSERGHYLVMNPPVRSKEDNEELWTGLMDGTINHLSTDHCAYTLEEKDRGSASVWETPPGIPGLETMVPLMLTEAYWKRGMPIHRLVQLISENAARLFGLYPKKGVIQVGAEADLTLIDLKAEGVISRGDLRCIGEFTPFEGRRVKGKPVKTVVRGEVVAEDGEIRGKPGYGRFVPRMKW